MCQFKPIDNSARPVGQPRGEPEIPNEGVEHPAILLSGSARLQKSSPPPPQVIEEVDDQQIP
jgi:hypothetical protein